MDLMNQHLICLYRTFLSVLSALNSRENIHIIGVEIVSHIVCRYNKNKFITTHSNKKVFEQKKSVITARSNSVKRYIFILYRLVNSKDS